MEATGKYHRAAHRSLHDAGVNVAVVNPARARAFAVSVGVLAKTDAVDAGVLALMAETLNPAAAPPATKVIETLQELVHVRQGIIADRTAMQNRKGETSCGVARKCLDDMIDSANDAVEKLDREIAKAIAADEEMSHRMAILTSIPGIGPVAGAALIVDLPELGQCDEKAVAALVGVAPYAVDSGVFKGKRRIRGGRQALRNTLYMAATTACTFNPDMKRFHDRLKAAGKEWKVIATAVIRKLVILANALVKDDRKWEPKYAKTA
jgi:transposase